MRISHAVFAAMLSCVIPSLALAQNNGATDVEETRRERPILTYLKSTASARHWLLGPGYSVMATQFGGAHSHTSRDGTIPQPQTRGYRIQERNGFVSGFMMALFTRALGVIAVPSIASGAYTGTHMGTEERDGNTYEVWQYELTNPAMLGAAASVNESNIDSAASIAGWRIQNFELDLFTDDWLGKEIGDTTGWRANFLLVIPLTDYLAIETGYGWGRSLTFDPNRNRVLNNQFSGVPVRLLAPIGPFLFQAGWDLNFRRAYEYIGSIGEELPDRLEHNGTYHVQENVRPWPASLSVHVLLWRLHAEVAVEMPRLIRREVGYRAALGVRF